MNMMCSPFSEGGRGDLILEVENFNLTQHQLIL